MSLFEKTVKLAHTDPYIYESICFPFLKRRI